MVADYRKNGTVLGESVSSRGHDHRGWKSRINTGGADRTSPASTDFDFDSRLSIGMVVITQWTQGIPIEVAPFAYAKVMYDLSRMGSPTSSDPNVSGGKILTLRMGKAKAGPVVSDNGNFIVDAPFPREMMKDPKAVSTALSSRRD